MKTFRFITLLYMCWVTTLCFAADDTQVAIWGAGSRSCGYWSENRKNKAIYYQLRQWALGYISAYNFTHKKRQFQAVDEEAIIASIDKICGERPRAIIAGALLIMTKDID